MLRNTREDWGSFAKALHWCVALLILIEVPAGFVMAGTYYGTTDPAPGVRAVHDMAAMVHHTIGFTILALFFLRLAWRARNPIPELPPSLGSFRVGLARVTHWAFYGLLILVPFSGWAALSVLGNTEAFGETPIYIFGWNIVPPVLPQQPFGAAFGYSYFAEMHRYLIYAGGLLLALHIMSALWHHLIRRDGVLLRMWPGTTGREQDR